MNMHLPWQRLWRTSALVGIAALCWSNCCAQSTLRLGIIGTDSSHAVEFTRMFNDVEAVDHVQGARIVAAYQGGTPELPLSRDRIEAFSAQLRDTWKLPFVTHIAELCPKVDGLLLLSVDPNKREQEFEEASTCGQPIFVDKPFASTLEAARKMAAFGESHHVRWFSASSLRFGEIQNLRASDVRGADIWGPGALGESSALDLSWYVIHSVEMLYAVLGPGVRTVSRTHTADGDVITGVWMDGRIGSIHVTRPDMNFGIAVFHANGHADVKNELPIAYSPLLQATVEFMRTGRPPVPPAETLEIFAFMDAAQRSMQAGSAALTLQ